MRDSKCRTLVVFMPHVLASVLFAAAPTAWAEMADVAGPAVIRGGNACTVSAAQDRGSENVLDKHARNDGDVDQDDSVMLGYLALHERSVAPTLIGRLMPWFALSRHDFGAN